MITLDKPTKQSVKIGYVEDGNIKWAIIDPMSTNLGNGETQLWSFASDTKGFFRKKVTESLMVTNFRIMRLDNEHNKVYGYILFPNIDDVIVMNTRRVSESVGYGVSTGRYTRMGQRFSSGTARR
jgi:hypothetical protein